MSEGFVREKVDQLASELDDGAVGLVRDYVRLDERGNPRFTGREFELLRDSVDGDEVTHRFTTADLAALSLLGVPVSGAAALSLLDNREGRWSYLLSDIGVTDDPSSPAGRQQLTDSASPASRLWSAVNAVPTMGPTRTRKLLARKRPKLLPVYDSVVEVAVAPGAHWWKIIAEFFSDQARVDALQRVRHEAGAGDVLSALRTLDVVLWMRYRGPTEG